MLKNRFFIIVVLIISLIPVAYLGSLPPSPFYYLKASRELIQSVFIFGTEDKANWILTLADKRLVEAEKLKMKKLDFIAAFQIKTARNYQFEAESLLEILKDKTNTTYLRDKYNQNSDRLKKLEIRYNGN